MNEDALNAIHERNLAYIRFHVTLVISSFILQATSQQGTP